MLLAFLQNIVIPKIINHKITHRGLCPHPANPERVYSTRLFINLPKKTFFVFSFSTGFLFVKKKKCEG